jgi:hypothetical protein
MFIVKLIITAPTNLGAKIEIEPVSSSIRKRQVLRDP